MQLGKVFVFDIQFVFGDCQKLGHIAIYSKIWTGLIKIGVIKHME